MAKRKGEPCPLCETRHQRVTCPHCKLTRDTALAMAGLAKRTARSLSPETPERR